MSEENNIIPQEEVVSYDDDNIRHLSDMEHVRTRPGMYIGRLGDGSLPEDGIYVLLKEVIDNSIDEFKMKAGDRLEIEGIQEVGGSERCGCQGCQCIECPFRSGQLS